MATIQELSQLSYFHQTPQDLNQTTKSFRETTTDLENQNTIESQEVEVFENYSKRAQLLRAAVLGANDGLLSISLLIMGVGAVRKDSKTMTLTGIAGLLAGACSMAIGEYVSVYSQYDTELAQIERENDSRADIEAKKNELPSPLQAAIASAVAFAVGAIIPLLGAAFIADYAIRVGVVVGLSSLALLGFGWIGAFLGNAPKVRSCFRVLIGGWLAMGITYGLTKAIVSTAL